MGCIMDDGANWSSDQIGAAIEGFFWPKIFWDFLTRALDPAVRPIPILQTVNLLFGIGMFALEWPLGFIAGSTLHRSIEFRLAFLPLTILASVLMYQSTNPAIYYLIGMSVYFWAYSEGEVRNVEPRLCSNDLVSNLCCNRSSALCLGRYLNVEVETTLT